MLASILAPIPAPKDKVAAQAMVVLFAHEILVPPGQTVQSSVSTLCLEKDVQPPGPGDTFSAKIVSDKPASAGSLFNPDVYDKLALSVVGTGLTSRLDLALTNLSAQPIAVKIPAGTEFTFAASTVTVNESDPLRPLILTKAAVTSLSSVLVLAKPGTIFTEKPHIAVQNVLQLAVWSACEVMTPEQTKALVEDFYFKQLEKPLGKERAEVAAKKLCLEVFPAVERVKDVMEDTVTDPPQDPEILDLLAVGVKPWYQ